jgi:hypothetical protein
MFFYLSKTVGYLLLPSNLLMALAVIGAALLATRFSRFGRRLLVAAVALMAVLGFLPFGAALMMPLEDRFPDWQPTEARSTPTVRWRATSRCSRCRRNASAWQPGWPSVIPVRGWCSPVAPASC